MTRKKKCPESLEPPSSEGVPVARKKLCAEERTVNSMESEKKDKLKHNIKNHKLVSSSSASALGGEQGVQVDVQEAEVRGGRKEAVQNARARISALQACIGRSDSAAAGKEY